MVWDWQYAWDVFPPDIAVNGLRITLVATVLGSLLAYALGLVLMLLRRSPIRLVRSVTWGIIEFVRSTPLFLVQIFFLFFVLPDFGVRFDPLTTGVIALGAALRHLHGRGLPRRNRGGAARSVGCRRRAEPSPPCTDLDGRDPSAGCARVLPALGNYTISMLKETPPLLLMIGVLDIVGVANQLGSRAFRYIEPITIAGVLFLVLSYAASLLVRWMERHVRYAR